MKLKIYSIYDSKTLTYSHPHFILNKGSFSRALLETLSDHKSPFAKYPADFTAFEIGEWDDSTGEIALYSAKVNLGCLVEYAAHVPKPPPEAYADAVRNGPMNMPSTANQ